MSDEPQKEGVWYRTGNLLYTLLHHGWSKGKPFLVNRIAVRVEGHASEPEVAEAFTERLHALLRHDAGLYDVDNLRAELDAMRDERDKFAAQINQLAASIDRQREELRDRFAMAAITGFLSRAQLVSYDDLARHAYKAADAMLKARGTVPDDAWWQAK
jgi:gamma-glutamyl:cysteine ligase YbdK (ATP-grasp superfamily)